LSCWIGVHQFYQLRDRFIIAERHRIVSFLRVSWIALLVKSSRRCLHEVGPVNNSNCELFNTHFLQLTG
jgi:hypothetical protein